jgi:hypothetical protein
MPLGHFLTKSDTDPLYATISATPCAKPIFVQQQQLSFSNESASGENLIHADDQIRVTLSESAFDE